jgi:glycosyltransferase involved in cell wall biosynthesis
MRTSVIVSTYNAPEWLEKVVWGFAVQSRRDFELIIADDGSTEATALLIQDLAEQTGLEIGHVWHEDRGFRKCAILNKAIERARADYLVFSDGDCIPRWDFVETHLRFARPGVLLSGGAVRLPMALSESITVDDVVSRRATDLRWLIAHGMPLSPKLLKLAARPMFSRLLDTLTTTRATWNGGNASAWKSDVLRVNGYDERMGHGGLDRELGERLVNAGVRSKQLRYRAVCVHLDHARGYARPDALERNLAIRHETRNSKSSWTPYGIEKPEEDGEEDLAA